MSQYYSYKIGCGFNTIRFTIFKHIYTLMDNSSVLQLGYYVVFLASDRVTSLILALLLCSPISISQLLVSTVLREAMGGLHLTISLTYRNPRSDVHFYLTQGLESCADVRK